LAATGAAETVDECGVVGIGAVAVADESGLLVDGAVVTVTVPEWTLVPTGLTGLFVVESLTGAALAIALEVVECAVAAGSTGTSGVKVTAATAGIKPLTTSTCGVPGA
jgi:hypothetical protein